MGIAAVSVLATIYYMIKSIVAIEVFFIWKNKINATGIVEDLKSKNVRYRNKKQGKIASVEYTYSIRINDGENSCLVDYVEVVAGDKPSEIMLNSAIPVFVDINKKVAKSQKAMKAEILKCPLCALLFAAITVICVVIVGMLES